jgi:hypothetical protein
MSEDERSSLKRAGAYISAVKWQEAKTMRDFAPHEYTIRKWNEALEPEFVWFVEWIRREGYTEQWGGRKYAYLDIDGHKYWTMGAPISQTIVINREVLT